MNWLRTIAGLQRDAALMSTDRAADSSTLPTELAFVVQLRASADGTHGLLRGRSEHISSGRHCRFESLDELVVFFRDALRQFADTPDRAGSDSSPAESGRDTGRLT